MLPTTTRPMPRLQRALAADQYNPQANYECGVAARQKGKIYDALDRFELCALTYDLRGAAYMQLARTYFYPLGDLASATDYARRSLECNAGNISAAELLYLIYNKEGHTEEAQGMLQRFAHRRAESLCRFRGTIWQAAWQRLVHGNIKQEMRSQELPRARCGNSITAWALTTVPKACWLSTSAYGSDASVSTYLSADASKLNDANSMPLDFVFPSNRRRSLCSTGHLPTGLLAVALSLGPTLLLAWQGAASTTDGRACDFNAFCTVLCLPCRSPCRVPTVPGRLAAGMPSCPPEWRYVSSY